MIKGFVARKYDGIPVTEESKMWEYINNKEAILYEIIGYGENLTDAFDMMTEDFPELSEEKALEITKLLEPQDIRIVETPISRYSVSVSEDEKESRLCMEPIYEISFDRVLDALKEKEDEIEM